MAVGKSDKDDQDKAASLAGKIAGLHRKKTAVNLLLDDPEISSEFRNSCVQELKCIVDEIEATTKLLNSGLVSESEKVDEVISEGFKSVLHSNQLQVSYEVAMASMEVRDEAARGKSSFLSLLRQGVQIDENVKTLVLEIGTIISDCLVKVMYLMTYKEVEKSEEGKKDKMVKETDLRLQRFRDSIPEMLKSLPWLKEEDDVVSKRIVPLLKLADGQLGALVGCTRKDLVFQFIAKKGLGDCLEELTVVILNTQACLGVPIFPGDGDNAGRGKKLCIRLAFLEDQLRKLKAEVRSIDLRLSNYKEVLKSTNERAFLSMIRFLEFMQGSIRGMWKDLVRRPLLKPKKTSRGLNRAEVEERLNKADVDTEGTISLFEECKTAYYREFTEVIGGVFTGRVPDFELVEEFFHQIFVEARTFSDLRMKISNCCDEKGYAKTIEKIMPSVMRFRERVGDLHVEKQASLLGLLKQAREPLGSDTEGQAEEEICKLERKASGIGKTISACLVMMMTLMTSEADESMGTLFRKYKSVFLNVEEVISNTTPGGLVLSKVSSVINKGQDELDRILSRRKFSNVFVTTQWFPTINLAQVNNTLDDLVEVTTRIDLLLTLPFLPQSLEPSTLEWLLKELAAMEKMVEKAENFVQSMHEAFKVNAQLKDITSIKKFLECLEPLTCEIWKDSRLL